jgi:hypothetical protein
MTTKVTWRVQPNPTGVYRSFKRRGWPSGHSSCNMFFMIECEDEYYPSDVREGKHKPLKLKFRDDAAKSNSVRTFTRTFATLSELKAWVSERDIEKMRSQLC